MDKQERGLLLADQEELKEKVDGIKKQLFLMGTIWRNISTAITSNPERIIFSNAPSELGSIPMELLNAPSFNWDEIPKIEAMAKLIQDLRATADQLRRVQEKLNH